MVNSRFGTASTLVGRESELAIVREQIALSWHGQGGVVLVSGEAGIGKSRLVSEVKQEHLTRAGSGRVIEGRCFEPDRTLPYGPFLDLLRKDLAPGDAAEIQGRLAHNLPYMLRLLPELAGHFPAVTPARALEPAQEKRRIFQTMSEYARRAADDGPVLLLLEDMHWSDDASLDLVLHLARQVEQIPVVMICTYRSDEVSENLRHMLAMLDRERLAVELALSGLTVSQLDLMLRSIFDQESTVRPDFLQAVHGLTAGNPFFVEEILRSLVAAGDIFRVQGRWSRKDLGQLRIPRSVQDAVLGRSARLPDEGRRILDIAAVIGQRFDFDLLITLAGHDEARLLGLLRELIGAGLVDEESADTYRFHHALAREAVYEQMLARDRRALHHRTAEALEVRHAAMPEPYLADLSYHFYCAEQWVKARGYAQLAGERALSLFAPQAAIEHFTRALEAAGRLGIQPPAETLRQRGRAYETLGDFDDARADFAASLEIAREIGDRRHEWQALIDLGRSWEGLDYDRAGQLFEEALAVARALDAPELLARSLNRVGTWYTNTERIEEARAAHRDALAIFEHLGDRPGIAATLDFLGSVNDIEGDLAAMRDNFEKAAAIFEELGNQQRLSSTLAMMCCLAGICVFDTVGIPAMTSPAEAEDWGQRARHLARETSWRAGEAFASVSLGYHYQMHGEFSNALECARESLAIAKEIDHGEWRAAAHTLLGATYETLRDSKRAIVHFTRAADLARASGSKFFEIQALARLATVCAMAGELGRAGEVLAAFDAELPLRTLGQRAISKARTVLAIELGQPDRALSILDRLAATAPNAPSWEALPVLATARARALALMGQRAAAEDLFLAAQHGASERVLRPALCDAHLELSRLYEDLSRPDDAQAEWEAAARVAREMVDGVEDATRLAFLARIEPEAPVSRAGEHATGSLTPREREVSILVARGLSNRQIGDELFIGERTVETHVSNTLAKLGFTSRAQIAAWVSAGGSPDARTDRDLPLTSM